MFGSRKRRRRELLRARAFPPAWRLCLRNRFPLYPRLPPADQRELEGHIQVFLEEKRFEGCAGFTLTDEVRVLIAAQACLLLLHRDTNYYPRLRTVLVYPETYVAKTRHREEDEDTDRTSRARLGESWDAGVVVLSWHSVEAGAWNPADGQNLVLHEFAHQLDVEDGPADGAPSLSGSGVRERVARYMSWARVLAGEFLRLRQASARGRRTVLDHYGATTPAEFFAVATECFFEKPRQMQRHHPALYAELQAFYRQDPAALVPVTSASHPKAEASHA